MPSPFPGMDPFLESPLSFGDLHQRLITRLSEAIQAVLPEPYFAAMADRVGVGIDAEPREPDVNVVRADRPSGPRTVGTAVADRPRGEALTVRRTARIEDFRETYLDIFTRDADRETLVTAVEILSPSNKRSGSNSRRQYLRKQAEILSAKVNLVEIDLLRGGLYSSAPDEADFRAQVPACAYHVCVFRCDEPDDFRVYPVALTSPLPAIAIPLLPGDGDVVIDLQEQFTRCYDAGPYRRRVRYAEAVPPPALTAEQLAWVRERLTAAGVS